MDFILLGCDGIFDKLSNNDIIRTIWDTLLCSDSTDVPKISGDCVDMVIKHSAKVKSLDNITCVLVAF